MRGRTIRRLALVGAMSGAGLVAGAVQLAAHADSQQCVTLPSTGSLKLGGTVCHVSVPEPGGSAQAVVAYNIQTPVMNNPEPVGAIVTCSSSTTGTKLDVAYRLPQQPTQEIPSSLATSVPCPGPLP
jgi:hypothetical protein